MKIKPFLCYAGLIALLPVVFFGQEELTTTCNLSGRLQSLENKELVLVFSEDMVALGGTRDAAEIVSLLPKTEGEWIWRGTQTLAFKPAVRFAYATRYQVRIRAGFKSLSGRAQAKEQSWEFSTPTAWPVSVEFPDKRGTTLARPAVLSGIAPGKEFMLRFNQPVKAETLRDFLLIRETGAAGEAAFELAQKKENVIAVIFPEAWKFGARFEVAIRKGFHGLEGDLGLEEDFAFSFAAPARLAYIGKPTLELEDRLALLPFNQGLAGSASQAVQTYKKRGEILEPLPEAWFKVQGNVLQFVPSGELGPPDEVLLRLGTDLCSADGDHLEKERDVLLRFRPARPAVYLDRGDDGLDLHVQGLSSLEASISRITGAFLSRLFFSPETALTPDLIRDNAESSAFRTIRPEDSAARLIPLPWRNEKDGGPGIYAASAERVQPAAGIAEAAATAPAIKIFHIRDTDFLVRTLQGTVLLWIYNNRNGQPRAGARAALIRPEGTIPLGRTDERGLLVVERALRKKDLVSVESGAERDWAFCPLEGLEKDESEEDQSYHIGVFTDRALYQPGEEVHIAGVVKRRRGGTFDSPDLEKVHLLVSDPEEDSVWEATVRLDDRGGFHEVFSSKPGAVKGEYQIEVSSRPWPDEDDPRGSFSHEPEGHTYVRIDEFQADRFRVDIQSAKPFFAADEPFRGSIRAYYLAGNPMAGESLRWTLRANDAAAMIPGAETAYAEYQFGLDRGLRTDVDEVEAEARLDEQGLHTPAIDWRALKGLNFAAACEFVAAVETEEGKEGADYRWFTYLPGRRIVGIKMPSSIPLGEVKADLVLLDASLRRAEGRIDVSLYRRDSWKDWDEPRLLREFKSVDVKGSRSFAYRVDQAGSYILRCDARDPEGRTVSTSADFWAGESAGGNAPDQEPRIRFDKPAYHVGDRARLQLSSPVPGRVLLTVEQGRLLDAFVTDTPQAAAFELPIRKEYFQRIHVQAVVVDQKGRIASAEDDLEIADEEKKLDVDILGPAEEIRPGARSAVRLKVRDARGRGLKARAFVYAVDEGVLQMEPRFIPSFFESFYYYDSEDFFPEGQIFFSRDDAWLDFPAGPAERLKETAAAGIVADEADAPVPGAVVVLNSRRAAITDARGYFLFARIPRDALGGLRLSVHKDGYFDADRYESLDKSRPFRRLAIVMRKIGRPESPASPARRLLFDAQGFRISGRVTDPEKSPLPGVTVTVCRADDPDSCSQTETDERGRYSLLYIPRGRHIITFHLEGFQTVSRTIQVLGTVTEIDASLPLGVIAESITVVGMPATTLLGDDKTNRIVPDALEWRNILRKDFRKTLFFEAVETDENGEAAVSFRASDQISTFRIMAAAYTDDAFGSAESSLLVSQPLVLEEALPEFARQGDRFRGGILVANRTAKPLAVEVAVRCETLAVSGATQTSLSVPSRGQQLVPFDFAAPKAGAGIVDFYAAAAADKDALRKTLPVTERVSYESLLDFAVGADIRKSFRPVAGAKSQSVKLKAAPSILRPAVQVAEKLEFYPYECLEQRAAKVMPDLALDDAFLLKLKPGRHTGQIRGAIEAYLKVIPEFLNPDGGASYYRGSDWSSDYLTLYVLWSLKLAQAKNFPVDADLMSKLETHLAGRSLKNDGQAFLQYLRALDGRADAATLQDLFERRAGLSVWGRVFLYRTLNRQSPKSGEARQLLAEFRNSLQIESDFAYFDLRELAYDRDMPFASSRFATAMLLQAVLEGEGAFDLAPRVINWLLRASPHEWNTTQTNFWILYAMNAYARTMERETASRVEVDLLGERAEKVFSGAGDDLRVEKDISGRTSEFTASVKADRRIYLTSELRTAVPDAAEKNRGIRVERRVYDEEGREAARFVKGRIYQVEILLDADKDVPYVVIDEPLAAGFEKIRTEFATVREVEEFNSDREKDYASAWLRQEHSPDRVVFYSYGLPAKTRIVYFLKALYKGDFAWLPTTASGMYHPQFFGRAAFRRVKVE